MAKPKYSDMVGERFGKLVVLERILAKGAKNSAYRCKCDCGEITKVSRVSLVQGHSKSCGCLRRSPRQIVKGKCKECGDIFTGAKNRVYCPECGVKRMNRKAVIRNHKIKKEMIAAYGGKCACCGLDDWRFLSIDHVNNNGGEERKKLYGEKGGYSNAGGGITFYKHLRKLGYPKDNYQLLCFNCNMGKAIFGKCPHETEREQKRE